MENQMHRPMTSQKSKKYIIKRRSDRRWKIKLSPCNWDFKWSYIARERIESDIETNGLRKLEPQTDIQRVEAKETQIYRSLCVSRSRNCYWKQIRKKEPSSKRTTKYIRERMATERTIIFLFFFSLCLTYFLWQFRDIKRVNKTLERRFTAKASPMCFLASSSPLSATRMCVCFLLYTLSYYYVCLCIAFSFCACLVRLCVFCLHTELFCCTGYLGTLKPMDKTTYCTLYVF